MRLNATEMIGRRHARWALAAARLTPQEHEVVERFPLDVAAEIEPGEELRTAVLPRPFRDSS